MLFQSPPGSQALIAPAALSLSDQAVILISPAKGSQEAQSCFGCFSAQYAEGGEKTVKMSHSFSGFSRANILILDPSEKCHSIRCLSVERGFR